MSLSLVGSVRSCVKRAAAVAVGLSTVFASGGAWAEELMVTAAAVGGGSVDAASKTVERGGTVSFTATADAGKELYAWFGAPGNCGTRLKTTIVISNVTENLSLTARFGTPYYVEDCNAASDAAGYGASADKPFRTPVYAAQNAPEYAICHLKGTLKPATTIVLNRPVRLSGEGTGSTTIGGTAIAAEVRLFEISHADAVFDNVKFDGFTSTHAKYNEHLPGAMGWVSQGLLSDALVTNCTLYQYHNDGAVANTGGHVVRLEVVACKQTSSATGVNSLPFYQNAGYTYDCTFRDTDTIVPGGNVRIDGGTMDHCRIVANGIKNFGASANFNPAGGVYITGGTLMNSLIKDNAAENAVAGLYAVDKAVVSNCTFVGNLTYSDDSGDSNGRSAIVTGNGKPRISRCVIWQNGVPTMPYPQVNVHAGTMSDCVLTADPLFVDPANGDYRLKIGSPAIALGAGCEPYAADHSALRCGFGVATNDVPAGGGSVVTAMVEGAGDNAVSYAWYLDDAVTPFATTPEATLSNLAAGYHKVKLAVTAGGKTVECERARAINVHPFVAYVSNGGSATYPYDTEGKATPSFTDAFCALWQGPNATSDLYVAEGSYPMKASHVMTSAVRVHGAGRDLTGLDGQHKKVGNFRAFRMQHAGALIENLTVSNIYFYGYHKSGSGGGVKMSAGTVRNCRFYQCELEAAYQYAAGVYMTGGLVADCDFVDSFLKWAFQACGSSLYQGGGFVTNCVFRNHNRKMTNNGIASMAYVEAGTMDACQIVGNGCDDWALPCVGLYVNGGTVRNTLVAANTNNTDNAGVYVKKGTFEFSTVVGNVTRADTDGRSGIQVEGGTVRNCIIHGNGPVGSSAGSLCLSGGTFVTNLVDKANARAVDCFVAAPGFADAATGDYRLKLGSPAIDAASPTDLDHDLAGNVRPNGKACDLGAYEYVAGASGFICSISISQSEWPSGASPEAMATVEGAPGAVTYAWYADGGTEPISTEENLVWAGAANGKHALRLVVTSGEKSVTNDVAEAFDVRPLQTYAGPNGSNEYPYDTEGKAAKTLNDAFNALWNDAATPVCVHVMEGTV